jgi:type IV secretion system protein VirB7
MNRILAVAILVGMTGCSYTQPYVTNISPAGKNGILVEKCKIQMNQLTTQISDSSCHTSYVWLGGEGGKNNSEEGANPNNNVITIK